MKTNERNIEVIAYKGMNSDMTCRDFKYEVGKSYKTDKAELCKCGFHACLNPRDVLDYYYQSIKSRYFKVKLSGEITKCGFEDTKVAATEITILEEITDIFDEIINNTEWWKNDNVLDLLYYIEGFAAVRRGDELYNFIDEKGKLLSEQWFEWIDYFENGFARVQRSDELYNFIDKQGKLLSEQWFEWADNFNEGFARLQRSDDLMNFIDANGKILSNDWLAWVGDFDNGFAKVQRTNGELAKIDKTGEIVVRK